MAWAVQILTQPGKESQHPFPYPRTLSQHSHLTQRKDLDLNLYETFQTEQVEGHGYLRSLHNSAVVTKFLK